MPSGGITFSLEGGIVLASWSGTDEIVRLGPFEAVAVMMEDFLAQSRFAAELMNSVAGLGTQTADSDQTD